VLAAASAHAQPSGVTPPIVVTHVDAVYPASAVAEGKHADVLLAVTIDTDGHVTKVEVKQSGGAALDEAAIVAARQWTFRPAMRDGRAVNARITLSFHFAPPAPPPTEITEPPGAPLQGNVQGRSNQGVATAGPSHAISPTENVPPPAPVEEVIVPGRAPQPNRGASDFNLRVGELGRVPRANASEMLKLAPGILLTNEGGEGHAEQVFLRGFDAREGQDIEFTVGGVPINESGNLHGNGYADTHFIIPELVLSLRVVEGPFDPHQGNFAVAGSADYQLGLERRGLTAKYMFGSFGTERMLLLWGPNGESVHTFGGVELYKTDGFGTNRDAQRGSGIAQYEGQIGKRGSWRVTGQAYSSSYHSAGVLRDDDYRAGRKGFFDTYDTGQGGESSRYSIAGDIETRAGDTLLSQQIFVIRRAMRLRENFTGFLLDVQTPLQPPHDQRGDLLDLDVRSTTIGARGAARMRATALEQRQEIELGYYARVDDVQSSQQRIEAATSHPYRTETSLDSTLTDIGLYGDANLHATKWLALRGGARADLFTFNVNNLCAVDSVSHPSKTQPTNGASCLSQENFGAYRDPNQRASTASTAVLPRGSLLLGPFSGVTFTVSYGQGVRSIDPSYVTQDIKTPFASVDAYDAGVLYARSFRSFELLARSVVFETHVDKDLIFNETAGRNVLGNGTTRTGALVAARVTGEFFDEALNATFVRSRFDDTHLLVPYVPDVVVRSDTALFADLPLALSGSKTRGALSAGVTYVGRRALPYGQRSDAIFTIDTSATLSWRAFELGLVVTNLLDRRYRLGEYNYASDFHSEPAPTLVPMRHFTAGAPRAVFATFAITLGGDR
jgi:TonB family protein